MNRKAYILTFDAPFPIFGAFDAVKLHKALTTAQGIITWWHYLKGTYIIIVDVNVHASGISNFVRPYMESSPYLVMEVNLSNYDGILTAESWNWIRQHIQ